MILTRVGVFSVARISGVLYAVLGFFVGAIFALAAAVGSPFGAQSGSLPGFLFGIGSLILFPIFYGFLGFIGSAVMAWTYNVMASMLGGIQLELVQEHAPVAPQVGATPAAY